MCIHTYCEFHGHGGEINIVGMLQTKLHLPSTLGPIVINIPTDTSTMLMKKCNVINTMQRHASSRTKAIATEVDRALVTRRDKQ